MEYIAALILLTVAYIMICMYVMGEAELFYEVVMTMAVAMIVVIFVLWLPELWGMSHLLGAIDILSVTVLTIVSSARIIEAIRKRSKEKD